MQRPRAVTILAFLVLFLAASNLLTGILLITGKISMDKLIGQMPDLGEVQQDFEQTMKVIIVLFSVLGIAVALGLLGMKNWARATTRVLSVLGLLGALIQMIQAFVARDAPNFLFYAVVGGAYYWAFFYLGQAPVRAAFAPPRPPGSEPQPPIAPGSNPTG
jgi:hypothetical protein